MSRNLFILFFLLEPLIEIGAVTYQAEEEKIKNLSEAVLQPSYKIGVFEWTNPKDKNAEWFTLESGVSLRDVQHIPDASTCWYVFKLIQPIKGEFDNLIFFKECASFDQYPSFLPEWGSRWILILKSAMDDNNKLLSPSIYTQEELTLMPYLNHQNLFELYKKSNGTFCLQWPGDVSKPGNILLYSDKLTQQLILIMNTLNSSKDNIQEAMRGISDSITEPAARGLLDKLRNNATEPR